MSYSAFFSTSSYFEVVTEVTDSWDRVKNLPNYNEVVGVTLLKRMYEIAPSKDEWKAYSFSLDDVEHKSEAFVEFSKRFTRMLDMSVNMLGPDLDLLQEQMYHLGILHEQFEVMPHQYELMGRALLYTLEQVLEPRHFTATTKNAWKELFAFMAETMMEGEADVW